MLLKKLLKMKFNPHVFVLSFIAYFHILCLVPVAYGQINGKIIKSIEVRGNKRVDKDTILFYIKSKTGEKHSSSKVDEDIKAIYRLGQFEDIRVEVQEFQKKIKLIYIVKEIASIRDISFVGNKKISKKELVKKTGIKGLKKGSLYNKNQVKKTEKMIKIFYEEKGFFLATVRIIAKRISEDQVDLIFKISEKKKGWD